MDILERYKKQVNEREQKGEVEVPFVRPNYDDCFREAQERREQLNTYYYNTPLVTLINSKKDFSVKHAIKPEYYHYCAFSLKPDESVYDILDALQKRFPDETIEIRYSSSSRWIHDKGIFALTKKTEIGDAKFEKLIYSEPCNPELLKKEKYSNTFCFEYHRVHRGLLKLHKKFQQRRYYQQMTTRMFTKLPEEVCLEIASYCHPLKVSPPTRV